MEGARSMRAVKGLPGGSPREGEGGKNGVARWPPVLAQRAVSEDPCWTRAVGDHLARPQGRR